MFKRSKTAQTISHLGIEIPSDLPMLTDRIRASIENGRYETREALAVKKLASPEDTVLEVGAGIGFLSSYCIKVANVRKVVTFEANPSLIPIIAQVHKLNGVSGVDVRNAILAKEGGEADFFIAPHYWASTTKKNTGNRISVPKSPVGAVLDEVQPDIVVIDIEGGEHDLVLAIEQLSARVVMMELHPRVLRGRELNAIFSRMFSLGYTYSCAVSGGPIVAFERIG